MLKLALSVNKKGYHFHLNVGIIFIRMLEFKIRMLEFEIQMLEFEIRMFLTYNRFLNI